MPRAWAEQTDSNLEIYQVTFLGDAVVKILAVDGGGVVLGGGNATKLSPLPTDCRRERVELASKRRIIGERKPIEPHAGLPEVSH
jgi:hypothetical protein